MKSRISLLKIIDSVFILLFFVFLIYVIIDIKNITKTLEETQKEKIVLLLNSQKDIYSSLLKFGFDYQLKDALKTLIKRNEGVKGVKIISKKFNFSYPKNISSKNVISLNLKYKGNYLGKLLVYYNSKMILHNFFKKYLHRFIVYFIIIFPLILILWFYLRKKIKSLNILAKKTEKIDFRRISKIDPIDNYMEIIFIVKSINKLLTQINNFYMSQKNSLRKLIKYKKQLQTAQNIAKMASWEYDPEKKEFISLFKNYLGYKEVEDILKKFEDSNIIIEKIKNLCNKDKIIEEIKKLDDKYIKIYAKCITQGNKKIVIGVLMDVSNEIKKQERIHYLAYHDTLTGIANRTFLKEELKCLVNFSNRHKSKFAILYLDLDNFKMINDTFGHEIGDKVLIEITNRLKNILRGSDIFARIGGDEFVIVANEIKNNNDVRIISEKILKCLKEPLKINNKKFNVSFSIGISIYPDDSRNIETLFKYADIAMYKAKKEGKNRFEFINEELKKEIKQFYEIATEIKDGIEKNEFQLYFQPQIDIENKKIYGAEALIRWIHPKKGILSPNVFIPIAENNTLIYLIDDYVLKKAFEILNNWKQDKYLRNVKLSINISANSFKRNDFVEQLKKYLEEYKIKPENLEIEITETLSMQDVFYTINTLKELKKIGFSISIDDFGTGYSSLNYLKMLPFDVIKIDRSFIKDITTDKDDYVITKMIVELSKILNKKLIAEGVETKDVLTAIENLGCRYVQGYYFSKPLSEKEFYKYVKNFYA